MTKIPLKVTQITRLVNNAGQYEEVNIPVEGWFKYEESKTG